ncbi:MAG: ParM/StbA family protein [Bacillota bacterium]
MALFSSTVEKNEEERQQALEVSNDFQSSQKNVGVDLGYGFIKLIGAVGEVKFPSIVGLGGELQYSTSLSFNKNELDLNNLMVKLNHETYFVGNLALRQSDIATRSLDSHRVNDKNSSVLMLTALGLLSKRDNEVFNLVTGLPISNYNSHKEWAQKMYGQHEVAFIGDKTDRPKRFTLKKIHVIPQPLGTFYDQLLNSSGGITNKDLADLMIGIVDIGYKTTGYAAVNNLEMVEHLSYSNDNALSNAYRMVAAYLRKEYGINKEIFELDNILEKGWLKIAGKLQDIENTKNEIFEKVASKIVTDILSIWDYKEFDLIYLTGGGGQALAKYILPHFPNMRLVDGPQHANVRGYQKLATNLFSQ